MATPMNVFRRWLFDIKPRYLSTYRSFSSSKDGFKSTDLNSEASRPTIVKATPESPTEPSDMTDPSVTNNNSSPAPTKSASEPVQEHSGLDKAFAMFSRVEESGEKPAQTPSDADYPDTTASFATLLRNSNIVQLGDPDGAVVLGEIFEVIENDLYIDFGGKFHCVCNRPDVRSEDYQRGKKVRLRLRDLELSSHFMGATRDITLLEADATLLGLAQK